MASPQRGTKVVDGMHSEGEPFKGILFCGIMMTPRGPMVLEFNTRFGDPETEAILLRLETDILDLFNAAIDGTVNELTISMRPGASVCVVAASGGYPGKYASGKPITGLPDQPIEDVVVFHSGTAIKDGPDRYIWWPRARHLCRSTRSPHCP